MKALAIGTTTITARIEDSNFEKTVAVTVIANEQLEYVPSKEATCEDNGNIAY